ncbi:MAG: HEPN domain-containing protein, partial [Archaeoglobaceae archaeon]
MEFLKQRAIRFYSKAIKSFEKGEYDFAMFFVEQS